MQIHQARCRSANQSREVGSTCHDNAPSCLPGFAVLAFALLDVFGDLCAGSEWPLELSEIQADNLLVGAPLQGSSWTTIMYILLFNASTVGVLSHKLT